MSNDDDTRGVQYNVLDDGFQSDNVKEQHNPPISTLENDDDDDEYDVCKSVAKNEMPIVPSLTGYRPKEAKEDKKCGETEEEKKSSDVKD
eukprot:5051958-Ditylum_brightwellii.AAC.1